MLFSSTDFPVKDNFSACRGIQPPESNGPLRRFPQPDSPTSPSVSPGWMEKLTPSTAFSGRVFIKPVLTGKYCFKSLTSSKYSLLHFHLSQPTPPLFPFCLDIPASMRHDDHPVPAFPAAALSNKFHRVFTARTGAPFGIFKD